MGGLVLACGSHTPQSLAGDDEVIRLPATPGKRDVDPLLAEHGTEQHWIVAGTDADLAAVVLRLLRKERLATTRVGFVPSERDSAFARRWAIPTAVDDALALARDGEVRPVPLLRDDSGGVLLGKGRIAPVRAAVYCDEHLLLHGRARSIEVTPSGPEQAGIVARLVSPGLLRRTRTRTSRAVQLGCAPDSPVAPTVDGVTRQRAVQRWTWYRHTEDLRLIRR